VSGLNQQQIKEYWKYDGGNKGALTTEDMIEALYQTPKVNCVKDLMCNRADKVCYMYYLLKQFYL
jgi:hypothetical protein